MQIVLEFSTELESEFGEIKPVSIHKLRNNHTKTTRISYLLILDQKFILFS